MYSLEGVDTNREWVEIKNNGQAEILENLRLSDKKGRHLIKSLSGETEFPANSCVVISSDITTFKKDNPAFSGTVFESSFSLVNEGDKISFSKFVDKTETFFDSISYSSSQGADEDGNSLHREGDTLKPGGISPGVCSENVNFGQDSQNTTGVVTSNVSQSNNGQNQSVAPNNNSSSNFPTEPQIFLKLNGPSVANVGVDTLFKAELTGLDKKPIDNGRIIWSFGDGASKEGYVVSHNWVFPGEYLVVAEASSLQYNASNRIKILVSNAELEVANFISGPSGFVELKNNSKSEINLSNWILKSEKEQFVFPKNTLILSNSKAFFPSSVTGLISGNSVALFYPNGTKYQVLSADPQVKNLVPNNSKPVAVSLKKEIKDLPSETSSKNTANAKKVVQNQKITATSSKDSNEGEFEKISLSANVSSSKTTYYFIFALFIMSLLCIIGVVLYGKYYDRNSLVSNEADKYQIEEIDG